MNQLVQPQEQLQPQQVTAESFTAVMSVVMLVWMGIFVIQQVVKVVKGEEIERPPIIPK